MSQALLNLLNNASDALCGVDELEERWIRVQGQRHGEGVEIAVIDSGPGVPPQLASKIMEPYFSLKNDGVRSGAGLGLPIARRTVESYGGRLEFDSSKPNTYFRMWLPWFHKEALESSS